MPYSVSSQDIPIPAPETPNSKAVGYDAGPERRAHIDDEDADTNSFEDDDSSVQSEDFYSFISHEVSAFRTTFQLLLDIYGL